MSDKTCNGPVAQQTCPTTKIIFGEGKYAIYHEDGTNLRAYRYDHEAKGPPWRDLVGDGMVLAMVQRIVELELALKEAWELRIADNQMIQHVANGIWPDPKQMCQTYINIGREG